MKNKIIKDYLLKDKANMFLGMSRTAVLKLAITKHPLWMRWKYIKYLRKSDFAKNKLLKLYFLRKKNKLGNKLNIEISSGKNIGPGLVLYHSGGIIINSDSIIGENVKLHGDNCIGNNGLDSYCPKIGNNVDVGVGVKIIGNVVIADGVILGANSVVVKDINEKNTVWAGVPARRIR